MHETHRHRQSATGPHSFIRHSIAVLTALMLFATSLPAVTKPLPKVRPERAGFSTERLKRITTLTQKYVDERKFAGVITMVARDGKVVHFEAVGKKGAQDARPLAKDDLFRIYSMSKPITAVAAMQLYEQGKFHLNDPVSRFVPEFAALTVMGEDGKPVPAKKTMTMHHLLTHTAGLSYGFNPRDPVDKMYNEASLWASKDLDAFAATVAELPLVFEPGTRWHYSVAVDITGLVVQRISGQPFDEYLAEHIFAPLGMVDTFFEVPPEKLERFLPNHFWDRQSDKLVTVTDIQPVAMSDYENVTLFSGGGGLVSTTMDYMRFAEALRAGGTLDGNRIIGPKTVRFMAKNHLPASIDDRGISGEQPLSGRARSGFGFGLGFGLMTDPVRGAVLSSTGEYNWGGAAGTVFWIDPVEDVVVVGMVQLMSSPWPFRPDLRVATYQALNATREQ